MDATVTMTGMIGSTPELRRTEKGVAWVHFRLACTPRSRHEGTWVDDGTIWVGVNCWHALAENLASGLAKGDPVIVTGRLRLDRWLTKDGLAKEDKVIEATAVGPDLNWGPATFRRRGRGAGRAVPQQPGGVSDCRPPADIHALCAGAQDPRA